MKKAKVIVLRTAGTNCDMETAYAFELAGAETELVHINALVEKRKALREYQILAIPGGFTYGDDVASGRILANELRSKLEDDLVRFISKNKPVIGICNGFQVLIKMGLLPSADKIADTGVQATLTLNDSGRFDSRWVYLKKTGSEKCIWVKDFPDLVTIPIAHAEGKFVPRGADVLKDLQDNEQIVFRYTDKTGKLFGRPYNPNGSIDDIAGICDTTGRVLGLMPHPERHISYLQHPNWRRLQNKKHKLGTGLEIFRNGVKYAEKYV
ncbi:MAG: phosphoribosylformylglycinamidine synthase I [Candidatus Omnitrophica bacterium]|nr:phosphoribosylformylglycinamidine synthase I [Candidatus Omnitrophota bacterium]